MKTSDFDYELPDELIAQAPAYPRDSCKLLIVNRDTHTLEHKYFYDIVDYLNPGDLLVVNETRVLPARLIGNKAQTGGAAEFLLLKKREDLDPLGFVWECLVKPGRRLKEGNLVEFRAGGLHAPLTAPVILTGEVIGRIETQGGRLVRFTPANPNQTLDEAIHEVGAVPLPPYITTYEGDPEMYQTVYAMEEEHSAAAPTAGLHFTPELIDRCKAKGVGFATVELEVGIDTFRIVTEEDPTKHEMHTERYHVSPDVIDAIHKTKAAGKRVIAVGTTSVRSLESAWDPEAINANGGRGDVVPRQSATTNLFLMPGSTFHVVDAMITNFHVPRSTLMMLVSAFATRDFIMEAYQSAIDHKYRMLSFGDAMFIQ